MIVCVVYAYVSVYECCDTSVWIVYSLPSIGCCCHLPVVVVVVVIVVVVFHLILSTYISSSYSLRYIVHRSFRVLYVIWNGLFWLYKHSLVGGFLDDEDGGDDMYN